MLSGRVWPLPASGQIDIDLKGPAKDINAGSLAVIPTDTVYGIAATPHLPAAVGALLAVKGRGKHMPPPILIGESRAAVNIVDTQADGGCGQLCPALQVLAEEFWPGPLTVIVPMRTDLGWELGDLVDDYGRKTVAIRMPNHGGTLRLLQATGPLAVTSANLTGQAAAQTLAQAQAYFGSKVAHYFDGGDAGSGLASTIVTLNAGKALTAVVQRAGAITPDQLNQAWQAAKLQLRCQ